MDAVIGRLRIWARYKNGKRHPAITVTVDDDPFLDALKLEGTEVAVSGEGSGKIMMFDAGKVMIAPMIDQDVDQDEAAILELVYSDYGREFD
jgi:hypothetical protein